MLINKIALIGGTGKSGTYLTQDLIKRNYKIKMLLRNPSRLSIDPSQIEIVEGNVREFETIHTLLRNSTAVVSMLGGHVPGETPVFSISTEHVIRAMKEYGIERYILITGLNVDVPGDKKNAQTAAATQWMKDNYPVTTMDKQKEFEILSDSGIDWTLIRLPLIEQTDERGEINVNLGDCPGTKISAGNLADFIISQLDDLEYIRKAPFIANAEM